MIYFISDGQYIKIGYSGNPEKALNELQKNSPKELKLLYTLSGSLKDKQILHKQLSETRVNGEWFKPSQPLMSLLSSAGYSNQIGSMEQVGANQTRSAIDINTSKPTQADEVKRAKLATWQYQLMEKTGTLRLQDKVKLSPEELNAILELPVYGADPAMTVSAISGIRHQQSYGVFYQPAIFCDAILRDSVIYSNLQVRVKALVGSQVELQPNDDSDKAKEICEECAEYFDQMVPKTEMEEMLRWSLLLGTSVSQIFWDTSKPMWIPRISIFHPKFLWYNWATRQFSLTTQSNGQMDILADDIQWSLFNVYSDHLPWMRGLVLPLAMLWLIRNWNEQWWSRHEEKVGSPIIQAIISAEATPDEERLFVQQLENLGSNSVVRTPQGLDGNRFDLELKQPKSDLYSGFQALLDYVDRRIAMLILGSDKITLSKTNGINFGGDDAGQMVRLDLKKSDASNLSCHLREKILKPFVRFNYGEEFEDLAPIIKFHVEPPENLKTKAEEMKTLADALAQFSNLEIGKQIDFLEIAHRFSLPLKEDMPEETVQDEEEEETEIKENRETEKLKMISAVRRWRQ